MSRWIQRRHVYGKYFCEECGYESVPTRYCGNCGKVKTTVENLSFSIPISTFIQIGGVDDGYKN